jgi:DEAD/DEAH box helicase domain-containing protein
MIDHVCFDVEIQKTIEETPGGWESTHLLGVACACLWEFATERMRIYGPDDVPALRERLLRADRISGYNTASFDMPVVLALPRGQVNDDLLAMRSKSDDMLARIWAQLGGRFFKGWKLDDVADATLGVRKIGDGAEAPKWFQAGQLHRVINYCADDVAIERDLCRFIDRYGYVMSGLTGQALKLPPWIAEVRAPLHPAL